MTRMSLMKNFEIRVFRATLALAGSARVRGYLVPACPGLGQTYTVHITFEKHVSFEGD